LEREANKADANHFLFTFAQPAARECAEHFCVQPQRRIFIDSGAFSVWNTGGKINLGKYIAFCKRIMDMAKCQLVFAALDVIPGRKHGPNPTDDEKKRACNEGWDNYQTMKQEGIQCLMTFHQFEHRKWLARIADDSEYFAVAPRKSGVTKNEKQRFLENVFGYIQGKEISITKKIHGLGVSSTTWMRQFPFYSVDNTAWLQCFRSHSLAVLAEDGFRTEYWTRKDFADHPGRRVPVETLRYGLPGEKADPNGSFGHYYLMYIAMCCAVETECLITDCWRSKGVVWDGHQYVWDAVLRDLLSFRTLLEA
jgi:hypothetical protein